MDRALATLCAAALLPAVAGCGGEEIPGPETRIELVRPDGTSPLEGHDHIRIRVRQGEGEVVDLEGEIGASGFDLALPLTDLVTPVAVGVELTGPGLLSLGAPPLFAPFEAGGLVRVPVGAPSTCATVEGLRLPVARAAPGLSRHLTFALLLGGQAAEGPSAAAGFLDLLRLDGDAFEDLPAPAGPARLAAVNDRQAVVLPAEGDPFLYDISSAERPVREIALHAGAGPASALLSLGSAGAVVIGGLTAAGASAEVTWIQPDGVGLRTRLAVPREGAVAVPMGPRVLVVGGGASGAAHAELIALTLAEGDALADLPDDGFRAGGALFASEDGVRALLVGGTDAAGSVRGDTLLFEDCPACTVRPGPTWEAPRAEPGVAQLASGGGLLLGGAEAGVVSALVDRVGLDPEPRLESAGPLASPRAAPALLALASGLVYAVGGRGSEGGAPLATVEVCFPDSLAIP